MEHVVRAADLLDSAMVHHHHPVRQFHRLLLIVRHEHTGHTDLLVQPPQPAPQLQADLGVERAEGLVEQQHARLHRQSPGQRHPLPLATGKLTRIPFAQPAQLNEVQ